jgi:hypothetical protein
VWCLQTPPPAAWWCRRKVHRLPPVFDTSARSPSQGGLSHRKVGGRKPAAPSIFSGGRLGKVRFSATRRFPTRRTPHEDGPSASPLGQGELLVVSSNPHSYHAWPFAAIATTTLRCRGEVTARTTLTCRSSQLPHWQRRRSTTAQATGLHRRRCQAPRLPPLDAVVISTVLGHLAFFVLRLECSAPPFRRGLVPVENRLLRERRLGWNKVGTLQLQ